MMLKILLRTYLAEVFLLFPMKTISITRCPPETGQGMTAGICVTRICSHYPVTNLIKQQHLKQRVYSSVCLHLPLATWHTSLNFEAVFIRRVKCISIHHQASQLICMMPIVRFI